ncbi:MAG: iron-containing alcohol dehydrogenase [Bacilli bacterium]|nr:iron-containing alcohol dehydrogenase [Bacilli bacterium]
MERYYCPSSDNELADTFALGVCKTTYQAGLKVIKNPTDYQARADLMLCSSMSHNDITNIGKQKGMPVHALEHVLSGVYDFVAHGAGLAVIFPAWAEVVCDSDYQKFSRFARYVFDINCENDIECAKMGISKLRDFFKEIGMPTSLHELGIESYDEELFWNLLSNGGTFIPNSLGGPLNKEKMSKIFCLCRME